jgi:hypothetical protein
MEKYGEKKYPIGTKFSELMKHTKNTDRLSIEVDNHFQLDLKKRQHENHFSFLNIKYQLNYDFKWNFWIHKSLTKVLLSLQVGEALVKACE